MRALCWFGNEDVSVETVPDPTIINPHDANGVGKGTGSLRDF